MSISLVLKSIRVFLKLFIALPVVMCANASISDKCDNNCFPEKIYTQCTTKIRSLTLEEKAQCSKMTADCQTCTEGKKAQTNQTQKKCTDICNTEQLIRCNKKVENLSIEEKAECSKMTSDCQTCTEGKKPQINQTQKKCTDICNTEQLIRCNKKVENLSIAEKAECSKMISDCQTCNERIKP